MLYMHQITPPSNSGTINKYNRDDLSGYRSGPPTPFSSQGGKCYDYNYKGLCTRYICTYSHLCMRCNLGHPMINYQTNVSFSGTPRYNKLLNTPRQMGPSLHTQNRMPNPNIQSMPRATIPGRSFQGPHAARVMGPRKFTY